MVAKVWPAPKLYSFPNFDRSDAKIYFPSTLARFSNSGDVDGFNKYMLQHCHKNCEVGISKFPLVNVSLERYMGLFDLTKTFHPDSMCCMHSTNVLDNTIHAVLYFKYTDIPEMYEHARAIVPSDPFFQKVFVGNRNIQGSYSIRRRIQSIVQSW